jgi:hypothetical protein
MNPLDEIQCEDYYDEDTAKEMEEILRTLFKSYTVSEINEPEAPDLDT